MQSAVSPTGSAFFPDFTGSTPSPFPRHLSPTTAECQACRHFRPGARESQQLLGDVQLWSLKRCDRGALRHANWLPCSSFGTLKAKRVPRMAKLTMPRPTGTEDWHPPSTHLPWLFLPCRGKPATFGCRRCPGQDARESDRGGGLAANTQGRGQSLKLPFCLLQGDTCLSLAHLCTHRLHVHSAQFLMA